MMDNVVSADEEFASIVADKGGQALLKQLAALHTDDEEISATITSALLSMEAMVKQRAEDGSKTGRAALFARLGGDAVDLQAKAVGPRKGRASTVSLNEEGEPAEDPLLNFRALLSKGVVAKSWDKGMPSEQYVSVHSDWNAIILKDASGKSKAGMRVPLRSVKRAEPGYGDGHSKKGAFGAVACKEPESHCMFLSEKPKASGTVKHILNLSFSNHEEGDLWLSAFERLVQTSNNWSHRLKNP